MRRIAWIADPPRFVEVTRTGRRTGRVISGKHARLLQYKMDSESVLDTDGKVVYLPSGWQVDWDWEEDRRVRVRDVLTGAAVRHGGRRHRTARTIRIVRSAEVLASRLWFEHHFPTVRWHPLQVDEYVWRDVDNWVTDVYDDDAPLILLGCYGEFADVTDLVITDDLRSVAGAAPTH
jgi:hypothetical protein